MSTVNRVLLTCYSCPCRFDLGWVSLGQVLRSNLAESISGQWCVHHFIGKRDIVDTLIHASRADRHNMYKQTHFPPTWRETEGSEIKERQSGVHEQSSVPWGSLEYLSSDFR